MLTPDYDTREQIAVLLLRLGPRERYVVARIHLDEAQLGEVGDELGICRERVRQIAAGAVRRLRYARPSHTSAHHHRASAGRS